MTKRPYNVHSKHPKKQSGVIIFMVRNKQIDICVTGAEINDKSFIYGYKRKIISSRIGVSVSDHSEKQDWKRKYGDDVAGCGDKEDG